MFEITYARPRFGFTPAATAIEFGPTRPDREIWQVSRAVRTEPAAPDAVMAADETEAAPDGTETILELTEAEILVEPEAPADDAAADLAPSEPEPRDDAVAAALNDDGLDEPAAPDQGDTAMETVVAPGDDAVATLDAAAEPETIAACDAAEPAAPVELEAEVEPPVSDAPAEPEPAPEPAVERADETPPRYAVPALRPMAMADGPDLRFPIEMRTLERRLEELWHRTSCPAIAIAGAGPRAGATTVSLAFARHLAGRGKRVLLCGDTVRARAVMPAPRPQSMPIDVISLPYLTVVNLADLYRPHDDDGSALRFERWLGSLKPRFDVMLLDLASPAMSADSAILLAMTDGAVLVVRAERSTTAEIDRALDAVVETGVTPLGFVVNGQVRASRALVSGRSAA